jgi:hypothetical protein
MRFTTHAAWMTGALLALAGCARESAPAAVASQASPTSAATSASTSTAAAPAPASAPAPAIPAAARPANPVGPSAGVRVFIDPATGEARAPTRAEREAAAATSAGRVQSAGGVGQAGSEGVQREHFVLPDGTEGVKLLPRDQHAVVVCRQADGSFDSRCPPASGTPAP